MIKTLIKLLIVVLIANAIWRVGSAYVAFYKFEDAVTDEAVSGKDKTDDALRARVLELAMSYDQPLTADDITIHREERHTVVQASYTKAVTVLPGYDYDWPFTLDADGYVISPVNVNGSPSQPSQQ